ncbi:MAG: phosphatidylserine decarboxylase family protein [Pirellulales bacterium]|nr:phosphatidylserine decarboxylase family protein [Pirellulales bacterium]
MPAFITTPETAPARAEPLPLPENFVSVQPGGGTCYRVELAWGRWRRWWLKRFRPGYVRRMAALRRGSADGAPHEILDSRDLKFCRNRCTCHWDPADDRFRWRRNLRLTHWGFAEMQLIGWPLLAVAIGLAFTPGWYKLLAVVPLTVLGWMVSFFRNPPRRTPSEPGLIISPADGKVVDITRIEHDEFIGGAAVRIGIFLSIFNVHLNRSPVDARVIELRYVPGEFLDARRPESGERNESTWIGLEEETFPRRRLIVRQISGAIARRIVCDLRPGEALARGQQFGMIKFGSRTELILAEEEGLSVEVEVGRRVKAGKTIMARRPEGK